jgi:catechol 2,3-dioxygenase-like lactoylglutathione lyase family enzyme
MAADEYWPPAESALVTTYRGGTMAQKARTTKIVSVSVPVADQDRAIRYYCDVLGFELKFDEELWPGTRLVEVAPPGSDIAVLLLPKDSQVPIGIRLGTSDVDTAHRAVREHDITVREEVLRLDFAPPMFEFTDPDGNVLVYLEDAVDKGPNETRTA